MCGKPSGDDSSECNKMQQKYIVDDSNDGRRSWPSVLVPHGSDSGTGVSHFHFIMIPQKVSSLESGFNPPKRLGLPTNNIFIFVRAVLQRLGWGKCANGCTNTFRDGGRIKFRVKRHTTDLQKETH